MQEKEVVEFFCDKRVMDFVEIEGKVKYLLFAQDQDTKLRSIAGWASVAIKNHNHNQHPDVMLDWTILEEGIRAQRMTGIPFYYLISYKDGIRYYRWDDSQGVDIKFGRADDANYPAFYAFVDAELCYLLY